MDEWDVIGRRKVFGGKGGTRERFEAGVSVSMWESGVQAGSDSAGDSCWGWRSPLLPQGVGPSGKSS